ncbi:hypothetical protein SAMN04487948_108100 [Halogranum amylolyticum]|uniref:Uncharacterized protein n=1 Tax=Halogranum amylolyticum TaxID=660520 RepID=A0A1H8TSR6_9EURY|nr:hypothetical protein [Halogranum amylolyticum]SEO94039.1 hypothetical protein SAMN04487948_108100 [Halogranum amylolyticum]
MSESGWNATKRAFGELGRFLLVVFGLSHVAGVGLALVVAPALVNEPWNLATSWALPVTGVVVVGLQRMDVHPTVRQTWTFGVAALVGFLCLRLVGVGDVRLSGSLYPVLHGLLAYVAVLAFAGFVADVGADDVRRLAKTGD